MHITQNEGEVVFDQNGCLGIKKLVTHNTEFVTLTIESRGDMMKHALPFDVTFFVAQGGGVAIIDGTDVEAQVGDVLTVSAGKERSWFNGFDSTLVLFVVKHLNP
ncbi:MAG: hypothetical protein OCC49_09715 [Fibrobacterales bacterium]